MFEDEDALNLKKLSSKLKSSFSEYYKQEKAILDRKKKDLKALKARIGVTASNVPDIAFNIASQIHENMTKAYK